jgi:hypothetical protein
MEDQALKDYFHFDEGDLQANRNGQLSDKQRRTLLADQKSGRRFSLVAGLGCGLGLLAIASIFPLVFIPIGLTTLQEDGMGAAIAPFIAAAVWALAWGVIGCVVIVVGVNGAIGKPAPLNLKSVTGPVNLVGVERTSGGKYHHTYIQHELHVGDEEFDVESSLAGHIMQGDTYAIFYLDDHNVLSLERLAASRSA